MADVKISDMTALSGDPASGDLFVVVDVSGTTNCKLTYSALVTALGSSFQAASANLTEYAAVNPTTAGLALLDDADATAQRATLGLVIGTDVEAHTAGLTSLGGLSYTGNAGKFIRVNAGESAFELATTTGGITDGDTLSTGLTFPNTGLHILDTNASHDLILAPGSDLTADRTLTITTGDSNRTLTLTGNASISGTNTGDQTNVATATALQTARLIGNASFDGTADITPTAIGSQNEATDTTCFLLFITSSGTVTAQPKNNTALTFNSATGVVGASGFVAGGSGFSGGNLTGNASTATALQNARTIGGVSFDGTGNIVPQTIQSVDESSDTTCFPLFILGSGSQSQQPRNNANLTFNSATGALGATSFVGVGNFTTLTIGGVSTTSVRPVLTADRTYYVRTDGSDSNDGLANTSGGAFLTIQKAVNVAASIDRSIYNVTIQVADGTYSASVTISGWGPGSGSVSLVGNTTTPANCIINPTGDCLYVSQAAVNVRGFQMSSTGGIAITAFNKAEVFVNGAMRYGSVGFAHFSATQRSYINITSSYTVTGGATIHYLATGFGRVECSNVTVTLSGTPAFAIFALSDLVGIIYSQLNTFSGSATGTRYACNLNSVIFTNGGGASYFPGNSAGSTATGGQYN